MRKKKMEELKQELKKELKKEMELEQKKKEKIVSKIELFTPPEHSKEELQIIQKSFLKILFFSVAILFVLIVILIKDPFKKNNDNENEQKNEQQEVNQYDSTTVSLHEAKDGVIINSNKNLVTLFNTLQVSLMENYHYDSNYLYSKEELGIEQIDKSYLMYMMTKTEDFINYIDDTKLLTKVEICDTDGKIKIPVETINKILDDNFGITIDKYEDFIYTHSVNEQFSTYIKFVYSDGYYVSFCVPMLDDFKFKSISEVFINEAYKEADTLSIKVKVAFVTEDKIYSDYNLTNVISDNPNKDFLEYIDYASDYKYIFKLSGEKFKLEKILQIK